MIRRVAWLLPALACCAPHPTASVTITVPVARPHVVASCPLQPDHLMGASCRDLGATCRYADITCICRRVPYCPGGVARPGPPPPDVTVEFECVAPECATAARGEPCTREGLGCRADPCYASLQCIGGRWSFVQSGPPP